MSDTLIKNQLKKITLPDPTSHKGQNGKLMIIGGSELFHAASKWSLDTASRFVDMVFYSSIPSNNQLIHESKLNFWNGIVVERDDLESYIDESDCILIGPGMTRSNETESLTNYLLSKYSDKKWVVDAGALQMVSPENLNSNVIITPHQKELTSLLQKMGKTDDKTIPLAQKIVPILKSGVTVLVKGKIDYVFQLQKMIPIEGGNAGMTKGGTGDVLAGLVAGLYCQHPALTAAVVSSYINKKTGDYLYQEVGPYFNATDLAESVPQVMWQEIRNLASD